MWPYTLSNFQEFSYPGSSSASPNQPPPLQAGTGQQQQQIQQQGTGAGYGYGIGLPNQYHSSPSQHQQHHGAHLQHQQPQEGQNVFGNSGNGNPALRDIGDGDVQFRDRNQPQNQDQLHSQQQQPRNSIWDDIVLPPHMDPWSIFSYGQQTQNNGQNTYGEQGQQVQNGFAMPWLETQDVYDGQNYNISTTLFEAPKEKDGWEEDQISKTATVDQVGSGTGNGYDAADQVEQLHGYLIELVQLLKPFASDSTQPNPDQPPLYLTTRFSRLSSVIHTTLISLAPHFHPRLAPDFVPSYPSPLSVSSGAAPVSGYNGDKRDMKKRKTPPPMLVKDLEEMSRAEREMEVIRKRRDALIAKAQAGSPRSQGKGKDKGRDKDWAACGSVAPVTAAAISSPNHISLLKTRSNPMSSLTTNSPSTFMPRPSDLGNFVALSEASELASAFTKTLPLPDQSNSSHYQYQTPPPPGAQPSQHQNQFQPHIQNNTQNAQLLDGMRHGQQHDFGQYGINAPSSLCHGCGSAITSGWRRGPDGPDSLCGTCGVHYERLMRKYESVPLGLNGDDSFSMGQPFHMG